MLGRRTGGQVGLGPAILPWRDRGQVGAAGALGRAVALLRAVDVDGLNGRDRLVGQDAESPPSSASRFARRSAWRRFAV